MAYKSNRDRGDVAFHPINDTESQPRGVCPAHMKYICGGCGNTTQGRVVSSMVRTCDNSEILWCVCACEKEVPTILLADNAGKIREQQPIAMTFKANDNWPGELSLLYDEAAKAYGAGAHTACAMVCRKVLMATACKEGDKDGKSFAHYVEYITDQVLTFPKAKDAINRIKNIGNEANHDVAIVSPADAHRAMSIVTYMLDAIYSLPVA